MPDGLRAALPKVFLNKAALSERFFENLFERSPEMRPLFSQHPGRRKDSFVTLLTQLALCAEQPETLELIAQRLYARNAELGVQAEHYIEGGTVLKQTLREILGPCLSEKELGAWDLIVDALIDRMAALSRQ